MGLCLVFVFREMFKDILIFLVEGKFWLIMDKVYLLEKGVVVYIYVDIGRKVGNVVL